MRQIKNPSSSSSTGQMVTLYFTVYVLTVYLPKKVLGSIHSLRLSLKVGSGLVPSYYLIIVIAIIST